MSETVAEDAPVALEEEPIGSSFLNGRKKNKVLSSSPEDLTGTVQEIGQLVLDHGTDKIEVKVAKSSFWRRLLRRKMLSEVKVTYPAD